MINKFSFDFLFFTIVWHLGFYCCTLQVQNISHIVTLTTSNVT